MSDLIDRQAAIDALDDAEDAFGYLTRDWEEVLMELPSAQPEPIKINIEDFNKEDWERFRKEWANTPITVLSAQPKRGKWIDNGEAFICSECRSGYKEQPTLMGKPMFEFCPMCGAKMEVTE